MNAQIRKMIRCIYIIAFLMLAAGQGFAQHHKLVMDAYTKYNETPRDLQGAKELIDAAVEDPEATKQAMSWHLRGFIYKDLFKDEKDPKVKEQLRNESATSLIRAMEMPDLEEDYKANSLKAIRYIGTSYFNDAIRSIQNKKHDEPLDLYTKFKKYSALGEENYDYKAKDMMFYNGMGGLASDLFEKDRDGNKEYFTKSVDYYQIVLNLDSLDWNANYNSGILYYNEGVHIINDSEEEPDFTLLGEIQEQSREMFKKALPFMLRAYRLDPQRQDAIHALAGIYFSLHDLEKSEYYNGLLNKD